MHEDTPAGARKKPKNSVFVRKGEKKITLCALCGKKYPHSEMERFCGQWVCPYCLSEETFLCTCCHSRVARSERADCGEIQVCQTCFDAYFTRCCVCGRFISQRHAHWRILNGWERPVCEVCAASIPQQPTDTSTAAEASASNQSGMADPHANREENPV